MLRRAVLGLLLTLGSSSVFADSLIDFETYKCIHDFSFFEYSTVNIYNEDTKPEEHGYRRPYKGYFECKLNRDVFIQVKPDELSISYKGAKIFSGPKSLNIVRVQSGESSHVELCFVPSQIDTPRTLFKADGGCIVVGLEVMKIKGPHTPMEVSTLLDKSSAP